LPRHSSTTCRVVAKSEAWRAKTGLKSEFSLPSHLPCPFKYSVEMERSVFNRGQLLFMVSPGLSALNSMRHAPCSMLSTLPAW
jgi:hypothetical protein